MSKKSITLIVVVISFVLILSCFGYQEIKKQHNNASNTTESPSTTESTDGIKYDYKIEYSDTVVKVEDYAKLKEIFDTQGIVVFVNDYSKSSVLLINNIKDYAQTNNVKINCVDASIFNSKISDESVSYVFAKLKGADTSIKDIITTPYFVAIKDNNIITYIAGFDSDNIDTEAIKKMYKPSFERVASNN